MATQTHEQDVLTETKQAVVQTTDSCQELKEGSLSTSTVQVPSENQNACQAISDERDGTFGSLLI